MTHIVQIGRVLEHLGKSLINDEIVDKQEVFKAVGLLQIAGNFNERKITGETGEFIAGTFYGVEPLGGNTPGYDLIDKQDRKVQVKMRHHKSDVDGLKLENVDVICAVMYDDDFDIIGIYEATPDEFLDNKHRKRSGGYSCTCLHFVTYATKVNDGNFRQNPS